MTSDEKTVEVNQAPAGNQGQELDQPTQPPQTPETVQPSEVKQEGAPKGAHAKASQAAYIHRSTRIRNILIIVIVVLILLAAAIAFFGVQIFNSSQTAATQQAQVIESDTEAIEVEKEEKDSTANTPKKTTVPDLVQLLGLTQADAMAKLAHGAQVTRAMEINEEGNPVKLDVQIALTEEPSDTRTGTPTVYLGMDGVGTIIRTGYSAATSSLGYGSLSFADAVQNEHIIESTLEEAGLTVSFGSAELPSDRMLYSTYDTDGTTLMKEYYTFTGVGMAQGVEHEWEAMLSYDYTMANATDDLKDTIRTIFIYIS